MEMDVAKVKLSLKETIRTLGLPILSSYYRCDRRAVSNSSLLSALEIADPTNAPRFYTLAKALDSIADGDAVIIECGVYLGHTVLGMANRLRSRNMRARIIGCDTFAGLPDTSEFDRRPDGSFHRVAGADRRYLDSSMESLQKKIFSLGFGDVIELRKGLFEDSLAQLSHLRFAVAHLDCCLYSSHRTCLEFLYPRMVRGGYMVFNAYDDRGFPGAKKAIDEFFQDKPEKLRRFSEVQTQPRDFVLKQ
jgi:O-methyltransferase